MKFKVLIAAILLSMTLPAAADRVVIAQAYEVALSELRLPRNENGTIAFKECESCDYVRKHVNPFTRYELNGKAISLAKFRHAVLNVEDRSGQPVTVLHHLKKDQVTAVSVYL